MPDPPATLTRAIITGGLGGFGTSLALALCNEGVDVTCVDVAHPGCAPFPVFEHRRQVLEMAGATVQLADMRADGVMDDLLELQGDGPVPVVERQPIPPVWFHCAAAPPPGVGQTPPKQYHEIAYEAVAPWLKPALDRGWWYFVLQHNPIVFPEDPRVYDADWLALLDAETQLRREFFPDAIARETFGGFFFLPAMVGRHQSPHTPPLRQYLQLLAGRPVSVCAFDAVWNFSPTDLMVHQLLLVFRAIADPDSVDGLDMPASDLVGRVEDWVNLLAEHLDLAHLRMRSDQAPASYLITPDIAGMIQELPEFKESGSDFVVFPPEKLKRIDGADVDRLIAEYNSMPWVPPTDWPRAVSRRRGRGRGRKR